MVCVCLTEGYPEFNFTGRENICCLWQKSQQTVVCSNYPPTNITALLTGSLNPKYISILFWVIKTGFTDMEKCCQHLMNYCGQ